jgi:hypothetical protein
VGNVRRLKSSRRQLEHTRWDTEEARLFRQEIAGEILREMALEWVAGCVREREEMSVEELLRLLMCKMGVQ